MVIEVKKEYNEDYYRRTEEDYGPEGEGGEGGKGGGR